MISAAIEDVAATGKTSHPLIKNIDLCRMINQLVGGIWVTPFTVDQLDGEFLDLVWAYTQDIPKALKGRAEVERRIAEFRKRAGYKENR